MNEQIRNMVLDLCDKSDVRWRSHIVSTVKYARLLSEKLGANSEVTELAAWLHDIAAIKGKTENHEKKGASMAEDILKEHGYDTKTIEAVKECILQHMDDGNPISKEQKILASADGLSDFDNFELTCYRFYKKHGNKARDLILDKYERAYKKIMPEARYLAKPRLEAIRLLLDNQDQNE